MPYDSKQFDRVLVVHWTGTPVMEDVVSLRQRTTELHTASGAKVFPVAVITDIAGVPDTNVRRAMVKAWPDIVGQSVTTSLLLPSQSVTGSLLRSVIRGMMIMARVGSAVTVFDRPAAVVAHLRANRCPEAALANVERELLQIVAKSGEAHATNG